MGESLKDTLARANNAIPDYPGAEKGLLGVKAPSSYRQTGDIEDRLRAAGKLPTSQPARPQGQPVKPAPYER